jgi:hypothetical protein
LRPKSARVRSATRKSISGSLGEASHIQGIAEAVNGWARSQDPKPLPQAQAWVQGYVSPHNRRKDLPPAHLGGTSSSTAGETDPSALREQLSTKGSSFNKSVARGG